MDSRKKTDSNFEKSESEWCRNQEFNNVSDMTDSNNFDPDDLKIKVEIELKEEINGLVYEPDFYGHLQLVNLNEDVTTEYNTIGSVQSDIKKWNDIEHTLPTSEDKDSVVNRKQNSCTINEYMYGQLKPLYDTSEEIFGAESANERNLQNAVQTAAEMCVEDTWQQHVPVSNQNIKSYKPIEQVKCETASILAEKKRNYRMRIKEENPALWSAIKQKEACKKREQREERRLVLFEMQRTMELISLASNSPELENHKLYLQVLQNRYPEVWKQLKDALSAAESRDKGLVNGQNSRHLSKPVYLYKDVTEAHKKYLYRQRMKQERPEMYAEQKARESYMRRMKRMMQKKKDMNELETLESPLPTSEKMKNIAATGEQNNQTDNEYPCGQSGYISCDVTKEINVPSTGETADNIAHNSTLTVSEIYNCSLESSWQQECSLSNQSSESYKLVPQEKSEAVKKREYRMRIKEQNPSLWSERKLKEANKKREQREERHLVLFQMQRTMDLIAMSSNSSEVENHKLYLQVLQERYPEVWKQLKDVLSSAESSDTELLNNPNLQNSRHLSKPVNLFKDVTEAHKKYLYRQKMKLERPEMYAQQRARDTQAKNMRRAVLKEADLPSK